MFYYRNGQGSYAGAFDEPQPGLIACDPPLDGRQRWDEAAGTWGAVADDYPVITARQLWLAAYRTMGLTEEAVIDLTSSMDDQSAAAELVIEIRKAREYERDHPAMDDLAALVGLPIEQFDALWRWAATL